MAEMSGEYILEQSVLVWAVPELVVEKAGAIVDSLLAVSFFKVTAGNKI